MKNFTLSVLLSFCATLALAQTYAQDFTKLDCKGVSHHLFAELDSGYCVLIEFAMMHVCLPCINAGKKIEDLKLSVNAQYPGDMKWYLMEFSGQKTCAQIEGWKKTNDVSPVGFAGGNTEVDYYGGMGMPTLVLLGGSDHKVLWKKIGFVTSDTAVIHAKINEFFATSGTHESTATVGFSLSPNPASDALTITLDDPQTDIVRVVAVFDAIGAKITSDTWASEISRTLDLTALSPGRYVVALLNKSGQTIGRQQFVKN